MHKQAQLAETPCLSPFRGLLAENNNNKQLHVLVLPRKQRSYKTTNMKMKIFRCPNRPRRSHGAPEMRAISCSGMSFFRRRLLAMARWLRGVLSTIIHSTARLPMAMRNAMSRAQTHFVTVVLAGYISWPALIPGQNIHPFTTLCTLLPPRSANLAKRMKTFGGTSLG